MGTEASFGVDQEPSSPMNPFSKAPVGSPRDASVRILSELRIMLALIDWIRPRLGFEEKIRSLA